MDIETLTQFFQWCVVLNLGIYVFWAVFCMAIPDWVYRVQSKWFPVSRETFNTVLYAFMGAYKIVFVAFFLVPYLALLIIG